MLVDLAMTLPKMKSEAMVMGAAIGAFVGLIWLAAIFIGSGCSSGFVGLLFLGATALIQVGAHANPIPNSWNAFALCVGIAVVAGIPTGIGLICGWVIARIRVGKHNNL